MDQEFLDMFNEILEEIKFDEQMDEEMKAFNPIGYSLFQEYEDSLIAYWKDGHGEMLMLVSEMHGFLDCLVRQKLVNKENHMYLIDRFRNRLIGIRPQEEKEE